MVTTPSLLNFTGAGRGLVVSRPIPWNIFYPPPNLLSIPSSALLNSNTLRPHYPPPFAPISTRKHRSHSHLHSSHKHHSKPSTPSPEEQPVSSPHFPLTSTQFVTLHLALHNPNSTTPKHPSLPTDPWAPYLACCPKEFDHHPLTWIVDVDAEDGGEEDETRRRRREALEQLADCLPRTTKVLLEDVKKRFWEDVAILRDVSVSPFIPLLFPSTKLQLVAFLRSPSRLSLPNALHLPAPSPQPLHPSLISSLPYTHSL